tara:strand:- start:838 stop:1128 length:291 start_codon:yes stop_codon:yes gene_type:complete
MAIHDYRVVSSSGTGFTLTGSIDKILALGAKTDAAGPILDRVEFGFDNISGTTNSSYVRSGDLIQNLQVPAGNYIEGPIGRVKVQGTGTFLFYLRK